MKLLWMIGLLGSVAGAQNIVEQDMRKWTSPPVGVTVIKTAALVQLINNTTRTVSTVVDSPWFAYQKSAGGEPLAGGRLQCSLSMTAGHRAWFELWQVPSRTEFTVTIDADQVTSTSTAFVTNGRQHYFLRYGVALPPRGRVIILRPQVVELYGPSVDLNHHRDRVEGTWRFSPWATMTPYPHVVLVSDKKSFSVMVPGFRGTPWQIAPLLIIPMPGIRFDFRGLSLSAAMAARSVVWQCVSLDPVPAMGKVVVP